MRHIGLPAYITKHNQPKEVLRGRAETVRKQIQNLYSPTPDISIVIPAYNEAENILKTLSSLADTTTTKKIEIIVVNNNSKDETEELVRLAGATCILETKQGITHARNAGLSQAKGEYILNADADTIYPPEWIDQMVSPLYKQDVAMVYGNFAFIPTEGTPRPVFLVYEYASDVSKWINKKFREEAVNIYGFNSAFRRAEGLQVDSFNHPVGSNEDGWLGLKLRNTFNKKFHYVGSSKATVWTTDRRIQIDGGLVKGTIMRLKRHLHLK
ncbi:glycosyltransferase family 2 protein [Hymenobacter sp. BT186]|uniref:Glycosyltransferase family 2 protein n=1 Tax=Hymenobacter telluris TaxID=2816474 RepID=A0A939JC00_9BACT|nr:glycosyltransferase family 2 protein [Hymenobacter telluris]MBO0356802.1 glycosyltransferase family 2 protein [Hymenobacter telluris]MBW3372828.1 glycosyltransferase [Hymenobacter norwichensis]